MSVAAVEGRSPFSLAMRRFRRNRRALWSGVVLGLLGAATIVVPEISPRGIEKQDLYRKYERPSGEYWFGTDGNGRDLLARSFYGGRISFAVGLLSTAMAIFIGVTYGAVSAFAGGKTDLLMMRFVDVMYGLPYMFLVIIVMAIIKDMKDATVDPFFILFIFLGCLSWMTMARIARGQVLSLREREFVEAARAMGVPTPTIIARHIIPNIVGPVVVYTTLTIPSVMLSEAFLSFLGLGISEPQTSWGLLISDGAAVLQGKFWWMLLFPGAMLAATLYCLNAVGDGLRDAFDTQAERS